jgi:D-glycerate 3-kinase
LGQEGEVALPSFDKAIDDRRAQPQWPRVIAPIDIVLLEGWCVGAAPQTPQALIEPVNDLEREFDPDGRWRRYVNDALASEYRTLFDQLKFLVLLTPPGFETVYAWRGEQERRLRGQLEAAGADTSRLMSEADLRRFIAHYERLTKHMLLEMPARADAIIDLDARRVPKLRQA